MNLQQLDYIIAVDNYRHFVQAADHCCVTQPTLSMMIKKLEEELNVKIFDRTRQPIVPTDIGVLIIRQARTVVKEAHRISELVSQFNGVVTGDLRVGVIPTIAPYLLPTLIQPFVRKYPGINLQVSEMITERIYSDLKNGNLDVGIVATHSGENMLQEIPLYRERFYIYLSEDNGLYSKKYITPQELKGDDLWLLEEGHCLSDQIRSLCELRQHQLVNNFKFRSGSIETLIKMVEKNGGVTILPELAIHELSTARRKYLRSFREPVPTRGVYLVTNREQTKSRLIAALKAEIMESVSSQDLTQL